ncbi:MAG: hypothetical protein IV092_27170 [Burkholderiaceae bacterium]|nr:hypothetical protein [Burkholderiaceae bacterium]
MSLAASGAWGLGLGRLNVQSALGEGLRAEIDVTSLSPEEAGTLKVRVAPPEAYRATGVDYNLVLSGTQVSLARRSNGQPYLRINSDRVVQEPFVDLILEINWASGRLVREYTLLFDPPVNRAPAPATVATAPVISPAPAAPAPAPAPVASAAPAVTAPVRPAPVAEAPAPRPAPTQARSAPEPAPKPAAAKPSPSAASEYEVRPGDNLSRIASRTQASGVSLDQMLVSLYRANPDAFVENNMNRLKAGATLKVPSSEEAGGLSNAEARQIIQAQSADFDAYRQRLASGAPLIARKDSERQSAGKVQAAVEDRKAAATTPDKLTLSKPGTAGAPAEAKVSKDTEKKDSAARVAELTRNVEELKKLSTVASGAVSGKTSAAPMAAAPAPAPAPTPAPAVAVIAKPVEPVAASAVAAAPGPAPVASVPAPTPAPKPPVAAAPAPAEEPGLLSQLMDNSLVLPISAVVLALLAGLGWYRLRGRGGNKNAAGETAFSESRLQPDSFFGNTGGQRVDTRDGSGQASSMSYSLSQLDAIGDVDPVAEADVYLAYGRDLQAEEILKEALRATPERRAIRVKLLEVYAKRRDTKGFEQLALQMYGETQGEGEDWLKSQELGRQIDSDNALYQPGGMPAAGASMDAAREPMGASTMPQSVMPGNSMFDTQPQPSYQPDTQVNGEFLPSGLDLDLDLDLDAPPPAATAMEATQALAVSVERAPMEMDFDISLPGEEAPDLTPPTRNEPAPMDFDLSSIDLDLDSQPTASPPAPALDSLPDLSGDLGLEDNYDDDDSGDPLARKIELADEFRQIGDVEGARDVLMEVVGKASGATLERAQAMLKEIG